MSHINSAQQEQLLRLTTRLTSLEQTVPATSVMQDQIQRMSTQLHKLEHAIKDSSSQQAFDNQVVSIRDDHALLSSQMQVLQKDVLQCLRSQSAAGRTTVGVYDFPHCAS